MICTSLRRDSLKSGGYFDAPMEIQYCRSFQFGTMLSQPGLFRRGYTVNGKKVLSLADFVPFGYRNGGLKEMAVYLPAASGKVLEIIYPVSNRTVSQRFPDGTKVSRRVNYFGKPKSFTEVNLATGQYIPSIRSIRWPVNTFNLDDIYRRVSILGLDSSELDTFELSENDGWYSLASRGAGCDTGAYKSTYTTKSFEPGDSDRQVSTGPSEIPTDRIISSVTGASSGSGITTSSSGVTHDSYPNLDNSDSGRQSHIDETSPSDGSLQQNVKTDGSEVGKASYTYFEPVQGTGSLLTHDYTPRYRIYTDEGYYYTDSLTGTAQNATMIPSEKVKREYLALGEITQPNRDSPTPQGTSYSGSSNSGSSSSGSGTGYTYSNSGSSSITWGSGQTSQTVTTSGGTVHTIYH